MPGLPSNALINGRWGDAIDVQDRGLSYGDGLFETIAVCAAQPQHWSQHLARLAAGADRLRIVKPSHADWQQDLDTLRGAHANSPRQVLKLMLTRGCGSRGYQPSAAAATRIAMLLPWPTPIAPSVRVIACRTPCGLNPALAGIKHLNRLEQVMGAAELTAAGAQEGLMFDPQDRLVAGTTGNVFVVKHGIAVTPKLEHAGVAGIMRGVLLENCARWQIPIRVNTLTRTDVAECEEIFFTNSLRGVLSANALLMANDERPLDNAFANRLRAHAENEHLLP